MALSDMARFQVRLLLSRHFGLVSGKAQLLKPPLEASE